MSRHTATCSVCSRVFPTTRLLNFHVSETHDSFFQAKVARNYPMVLILLDTAHPKYCAGLIGLLVRWLGLIITHL